MNIKAMVSVKLDHFLLGVSFHFLELKLLRTRCISFEGVLSFFGDSTSRVLKNKTNWIRLHLQVASNLLHLLVAKCGYWL